MKTDFRTEEVVIVANVWKAFETSSVYEVHDEEFHVSDTKERLREIMQIEEDNQGLTENDVRYRNSLIILDTFREGHKVTIDHEDLFNELLAGGFNEEIRVDLEGAYALFLPMESPDRYLEEGAY